MRAICLALLLIGSCSAFRTHIKLKAKDNPVAEVITLLEDLQTQTEDEGAAEAKTYDEFGCFCKDNTKEKSDAIKEDQDEIDKQTAELEEQTGIVNKKNERIAELNDEIQQCKDDMAEAETQRDKDRTAYEVKAADLERAVTSVEGAMDDLKSTMAASLVQTKLQASFLQASSLGIEWSPKQERMLSALLQVDDDGVPDSDFESHTGGLQDTIDDLINKYKDKKSECDDIEDKAIQAHKDYMKSKTSQLETAEGDLDATTEERDTALEAKGEAEAALSNANAKFADDSTYLSDLTQQCEFKAREWDQRSKMRADELTALAQALGVIKDRVKDADDKANKRALLQQAVAAAAPVAKAPVVDQDDDADADEDEDAEDVSFLQKKPERKVGDLLRRAQAKHLRAISQHDAMRNKVVSLLKGKNSPTLNALAMHVKADPFIKVKSLIQDLITKLVKAAADEATQKGWCDTELGKAKSDRDTQWNNVLETNANLEMLEAQRDQLSDDIDTLATEIAELTDNLAKMTENRNAEKAENEETLSTAKEGHAAITEAIGILEKFYKGAKKGSVSLAQVSPVMQDFKNLAKSQEKGGAYQGNQDASGGIIGMMEVIKSDFERTTKTTTEAEYAAAREFAQFNTETKAAISSKETEKGNKEATLSSTEAELTEESENLGTHQTMLDDALKELEELNKTCIDTGMSYNERVAKREEEIEALKEAMSILEENK